MPGNVTLDWNVPPSRLYSRSVPVGSVTITEALPTPGEQSIECAGDEGAPGAALRITSVALELHPSALLITTLYGPGTSPGLLLPVWKVRPLSKLYVSPGFCTVTVIVPVGTKQVGCTRLTTGTVGVEGCAFITTSEVEGEAQPVAVIITEKLYVP